MTDENYKLELIETLLNPSIIKSKVDLVNRAGKKDFQREFINNNVPYRLSKNSNVLNQAIGINKTVSIILEVQMQDLFETYYKPIGLYIPESMSDYLKILERNPNYEKSNYPKIIILQEFKEIYNKNIGAFPNDINSQVSYLGELENAFIAMCSRDVFHFLTQKTYKLTENDNHMDFADEKLYANGMLLSLNTGKNNSVRVDVIDDNIEDKSSMSMIYGYDENGVSGIYTEHPILDELAKQKLLYGIR